VNYQRDGRDTTGRDWARHSITYWHNRNAPHSFNATYLFQPTVNSTLHYDTLSYTSLVSTGSNSALVFYQKFLNGGPGQWPPLMMAIDQLYDADQIHPSADTDTTAAAAATAYAGYPMRRAKPSATDLHIYLSTSNCSDQWLGMSLSTVLCSPSTALAVARSHRQASHTTNGASMIIVIVFGGGTYRLESTVTWLWYTDD
jgi:hypothetical protein